jgi:hypothetical protein
MRCAAALGALACIAALAAGCRRVCEGEQPGFELDLSVPLAVAGRIHGVRIVLAVEGAEQQTITVERTTAALADGATSLAVGVGENGRRGFLATVDARALGASGELIAANKGLFRGSGDACNRFALALVPVVPVPPADAGPDRAPPAPDTRSPDLCATSCASCPAGCCSESGEKLSCGKPLCSCFLTCSTWACEAFCSGGSTCDVACPATPFGSCNTKCAAAASCKVVCNGALSCVLECALGTSKDCPGGVKVCNRSCP